MPSGFEVCIAQLNVGNGNLFVFRLARDVGHVVYFRGILLHFLLLFRLWLRAILYGAPISFPNLIAMTLRKVPAIEIVRLRILAVQGCIEIQIQDLERAYLMGADLERAVLAMIRAREIG